MNERQIVYLMEQQMKPPIILKRYFKMNARDLVADIRNFDTSTATTSNVLIFTHIFRPCRFTTKGREVKYVEILQFHLHMSFAPKICSGMSAKLKNKPFKISKQ